MSAGAAAAQAAIYNAIRSFGVIVTVEPREFLRIAHEQLEPLIVTATAGIFATEYRYLMSYKGLTFYTKSAFQLELPTEADLVKSERLSLPG